MGNQNVLSPVSQTPANYNMAQNNSPHSITSPLSMHNNHNQHQTRFARSNLPFRNWHSDIPRSQNVQNVNKQSTQTDEDRLQLYYNSRFVKIANPGEPRDVIRPYIEALVNKARPFSEWIEKSKKKSEN